MLALPATAFQKHRLRQIIDCKSAIFQKKSSIFCYKSFYDYVQETYIHTGFTCVFSTVDMLCANYVTQI